MHTKQYTDMFNVGTINLIRGLRLYCLSFALVILSVFMSGCNDSSANSSDPNDKIKDPKELFWDAFYGGNYERLPLVIEQLSGAFFENPNDPEITLLLAHSHLWKAGESSRLGNPPPSIFDNFIVAKYYFDKTILLNPEDYRLQGWSASVDVTLGMLHSTPELIERGYANVLASVPMYPEFNHFNVGFPFGLLPPTDPMFEVAMDHMWAGVDACLDTKIDRESPDYASYMSLETDEGPKRVCWNNDKLPHGLEGFFLGFGDMLVKNGQPDVAKIMYANAKYSSVYDEWNFKDVLEERIISADERAKAYKSPNPAEHPALMINEPYACVGCHAK